MLKEVVVRPRDDEDRFREAALQWLNGLYGFALSLARDPSVAEDLVQETYVRALAARRKAAPDENLKVWLFVILHNIWRNQIRRPRPERPAGDPGALLDVADTRAGPEQELERGRLRARLREAIASLPDSFRQVVVLRCVEELSYQEVAAVVGCGRLISFKNDAAAFVAYRMEDRPISLLVTSASLVRPAGGDVVASGNLRFHIESVDGLKVITWTDNGLTYALASDLDVEGARSCLVCHGSPEERRKVEPLARAPIS